MDDLPWQKFYATPYGTPAAATCTRRIDKGQLEKFTKAVLQHRDAITTIHTPDDLLEFETMTVTGLVHSHLLALMDNYAESLYIK